METNPWDRPPTRSMTFGQNHLWATTFNTFVGLKYFSQRTLEPSCKLDVIKPQGTPHVRLTAGHCPWNLKQSSSTVWQCSQWENVHRNLQGHANHYRIQSHTGANNCILRANASHAVWNETHILNVNPFLLRQAEIMIPPMLAFSSKIGHPYCAGSKSSGKIPYDGCLVDSQLSDCDNPRHINILCSVTGFPSSTHHHISKAYPESLIPIHIKLCIYIYIGCSIISDRF